MVSMERGATWPAAAKLFSAARSSCAALREAMEAGADMDPIAVFDAGSDLFGHCVECGAWPGERHLSPCEAAERAKPGDAAPVWWGEWAPDDHDQVVVVRAVVHLFKDLGEAADTDLTVAGLDELLTRHLGPERQCTGNAAVRWCGDLATDVARAPDGCEWFCCPAHRGGPETRLTSIVEWFARLFPVD